MDRVDLTGQFGTDRQRCWRSGWAEGPFVTTVTFGKLADGRWFADRRGREGDSDDHRFGACVYAATDLGRTLALRMAYRWMRTSSSCWKAEPATFDTERRPADGLPWVRRGGEWVLQE
jgi:hypothetical protein